MKYIFISDDRFFLQGVRGGGVLNDTIFISVIDELHTLSVGLGDVVILTVKNTLLRAKVMEMSVMKTCRLLIMLHIPVSKNLRRKFPWILRVSLSLKALWDIIGQAEKAPVMYDNATEINNRVFNRLGEGMPVPLIASYEQLTEQHVYRIKRNAIIRYGMVNCNYTSVLVCRDILNISKMTPTKQVS